MCVPSADAKWLKSIIMVITIPTRVRTLAAVLLTAGCMSWGSEPERPLSGFTIQCIKRLPEIPYTWQEGDPLYAGSPAVGDTVIWRAFVKNWNDTSYSIDYTWRLDGETSVNGTITLEPESIATVDFPWEWTVDRNTPTFILDPEDKIAGRSESNNEWMIYTGALPVGFWVEQSVYNF